MCVDINWHVLAKFHGNTLNLSENTAKSYRGYFLTHTLDSMSMSANLHRD